MKRHIYIVISVIAAASAILFLQFFTAPQVTANAVLSRSAVFVGDRAKYSIISICAKDIEVEIPDIAQNLDKFKIIDKGLFQRDSFVRRRYVRWYIIAGYDVGEYTIASAKVKYKREDGSSGTIETNETRITIKSVLSKEINYNYKVKIGGGLESRDDSGRGSMRDVEGPINFKIIDDSSPAGIITYSDVGILAAAALALIALIFFAFNFIHTARSRPRQLSPYETAESAIEALRAGMASGKTGAREISFELSRILREYMRPALALGAAELTTKEFVAQLELTAILTADQKKILKDMIALFDLIKFSGYIPKQSELEMNLEKLRAVIHEVNSSLQRTEEIK